MARTRRQDLDCESAAQVRHRSSIATRREIGEVARGALIAWARSMRITSLAVSLVVAACTSSTPSDNLRDLVPGTPNGTIARTCDPGLGDPARDATLDDALHDQSLCAGWVTTGVAACGDLTLVFGQVLF